jgi:hypothetical protein
MRTAAGFHHHQAYRPVDEEAFELRARQAKLFNDPPNAIRDRNLKHGLGEIHSHYGQSSGSIHVGLLLVER